MYTKKPDEVAIPHFCGYNVQLPNVENMPQDFTNSLYSWCYTFYKAHKERKTTKEVLEMTPMLQDYAKVDAGFDQFCKRYAFIATDPESRKKHLAWVLDCMKIQGQIDAAFEDGIEKGIEKGIEQGIEKGIEQGIEQGIEKGIEQGIKQGIKKGIEQGKTKAIEEVALNMMRKGLSVDLIKAITGLSDEKLKQLESVQTSQPISKTT